MTLSPTAGSTAVAGCCTVSVAAPTPMKPACTTTGSPEASVTTVPFASIAYRSLSIGVTVNATSSPSRTTTSSIGSSG